MIKNTTVCVVGGAGFLGSHLVNYLVEDRNCRVIVVDNLCVGRREYIHPKATFVHHDICGSEEFLTKLFARNKIEYVFNYAAWPYIPVSFARPLQVFDVNATGAIKVINAAHTAKCHGILQVSSAELYGEAGGLQSLSEAAPVAPHSTYGAAKAAVDYYCQAAWKERCTPVIALRQFNCVGPRETHPYIVPEIISQLHRKPEVRLGNNSERDFMYAGDAVRIAVSLLERGQCGDVYNLGSEHCVKIYTLAQMLGQIMWNKEIEIKEDEKRVRPWEIWRLCSDNSKIYGTVSERPSLDLEKTLRLTVAAFYEAGEKWSWE